jgi:L-iditol 2-dehydrogenase
VPCGECRFCRAGHETVCDTLRKTSFDPGGFAEFVRIPRINLDKFGVYSIPKNVSFEEATFIEPLACVIRGQRLAGFRKEKSVLVVGSGISGLLHIKLARASGAKNIVATDINGFRLDAAKRSGADHAFNAADYTPDKFRAVNGGYLADLVVICAGAQSAFEQGLRSVERGGTALVFAAADKDALLPVPTNDIFWRNEVTVLSSYAGSPADHVEALGKIDMKKVVVSDMITHRFGLFDAVKGFSLVALSGESLKVIVEPQR